MALKQIPASIVFDHNDPDFLNQTFGAGDDATTWTFSFWLKIGIGDINNNTETILSAGTSATDNTTIHIGNNGGLSLRHEVGGSVVDNVGPQIFFLSDPTAWYHIVIAYDSNEAVASDRIKIWSNNRRMIQFNPSNFPSLGANSFINTAVEHRIGNDTGALFGDNRGYLADVYFIDGQALTPSSFGELVDDSWQPIAASPTFGTNGYLLEFGTAAALGDDTSGNTNDWTQNSITTANQRDDTPTANHLTLNPWRVGKAGFPDPQLHFGNRQLIAEAANNNTAWATSALPKTGKYYWEVDIVIAPNPAEAYVGVVTQLSDPTLATVIGVDNYGWALRNSSGTVLEIFHAASALVTFTDTGTLQTGDYAMVAFDSATGNLWFGINGTWLDSGDPGAGTNPAVTLAASEIFGDLLIPAVSVGGTAGNNLQLRAGLEDLQASVPIGFVTLRVDAWPIPPITKPSDHFTYITWDGDSTSPRSITGTDFQPDLAWVKDIASVGNHILSDITKGAGTVHRNNATTIADDAAHLTGEISAFNADGISVQDGATNGNDVNLSGRQYVALLWAESALAGLDLVGYAGDITPQNIPHALGVAPDFMYVRNRDMASDNEVYFGKTLDGAGAPITDPETDSVQANTTAALADSAGPWDDTAPDASNFRVGSDISTNVNAETHQAYLFAEVEGFSKIGAYRGTGSNLPAAFIYCGFRPRMVLIKRLDAVDDWALFIKEGDNTNFNGDYEAFQQGWQFWRSNLAQGDQSPGNPGMIICASGFALREVSTEFNTLGEYAFIAFAEVPFKLTSASSVQPKNADGALDLKFQIDATGDLPNQHGDGVPDLGIQINATGDLPNQHGDGVPDLGIQIDGQGTNVNRHGDGAVDLKFVLNGTGDYPGEFGDGALDLGIQLNGQGSNPAIHGDGAVFLSTELFTAAESGDDGGSVSLPALQTSGFITSSFPITGSVRIPPLQVVATIDNASVISGSVRLPQLQTQGEIDGDMDVDLPLLQVEGTMVPGRAYFTDSLGLRIPVLQVVGAGISQQLSGGSIVLPKLRVQGSILPGAVVTENPDAGGLVLPQLQVEGFLFIPNEGTGSVLLPALDIDPLSFIAAGSIGGGSVTLPFVQVEGIIVNGVTLAGTVWVMNTETFETTNYLNFDFDSLVSFNEQPYGVTSSGIFLLEGDDDNGTNIDSRILTGISDRGDENLKEVAHLYLQYEGRSVILQLLPDGQQRVREYDIKRRSNSAGLIHARAKGARGLRSRSWQMGFRNTGGGDFTLDKMGLLLRQLTRKTRKN